MRWVRQILTSPKVRDVDRSDLISHLADHHPAARNIKVISHLGQPRRLSEGDITVTDSKRIPVTLTGDQHVRFITVASSARARRTLSGSGSSALPVFVKEPRRAEAQKPGRAGADAEALRNVNFSGGVGDQWTIGRLQCVPLCDFS